MVYIKGCRVLTLKKTTTKSIFCIKLRGITNCHIGAVVSKCFNWLTKYVCNWFHFHSASPVVEFLKQAVTLDRLRINLSFVTALKYQAS